MMTSFGAALLVVDAHFLCGGRRRRRRSRGNLWVANS